MGRIKDRNGTLITARVPRFIRERLIEECERREDAEAAKVSFGRALTALLTEHLPESEFERGGQPRNYSESDAGQPTRVQPAKNQPSKKKPVNHAERHKPRGRPPLSARGAHIAA